MIASITKVFTSALMYAMEERGILSRTDPLVKYMSEWTIKGSDSPITLEELASHTAGLPSEVPFPCSFSVWCTDADVLSAMAERYLVVPPSTKFHYSNLGFALLGRALAHAANAHYSTNSSYEEWMQELILQPLGMNSTFTLNSTYIKRLARGITENGQVAPLWKDTWDAACGGLFASAADIARLMSQTLLPSDPKTRHALTAENIRESLAPVVLMADGSEAVGSPWEMRFQNSEGVPYWIKSKQGSLPGYRSSVALVPQLGFGIFINALVSETKERSVYAFPALDILAPAVNTLLARRVPAQPPMPQRADGLVGNYYLNASVQYMHIGTGRSVLVANVFGSTYQLSSFDAEMDGADKSAGTAAALYPVRVHAYPACDRVVLTYAGYFAVDRGMIGGSCVLPSQHECIFKHTYLWLLPLPISCYCF
jgi:D-alanyl-D-alanine-carboxypeptidase/D-alanyl-D-alanine-endopeptidase